MKKQIQLAVAGLLMLSTTVPALAGSNDGVASATPVGTLLGSATLWSVVNADGTTARSDGGNATTTRKLPGFLGSYEVIFRRNVTGCAYVATIGNAGAGNPPHGTIVVAARSGNPLGVFVETRTVAGALADLPFHVFVNC